MSNPNSTFQIKDYVVSKKESVKEPSLIFIKVMIKKIKKWLPLKRFA